MNRFVNEQYVKLCKSYNDEYARVCNLLMDGQNHEPESEFGFDDDLAKNGIHNSMNEWCSKPLVNDDSNVTANSIIDGISDVGEAINLACYAVVLCDDELPDCIKIKLGSFGTAVFSLIADRITQYSWSTRPDDNENNENNESAENDEDDLIICSSFLKLLGDWECLDQCEPVIAKFCQTENPHELIADAVRYYLVALGNGAVSIINKYLGAAAGCKTSADSACEYLLIALTDIGKDNHTEEIYTSIKSCFRTMPNKVIGAICLGDYGDGRGIQVLKGWLDRHPEEKDRQLLSEVLSAIKRLGGDISDVQHRLKLN